MPPSKKRSAKKGDKPLKLAVTQQDEPAAEERGLLPNAPTMVCSDDGLRMVNAEEAQNKLDKLYEKKKALEAEAAEKRCREAEEAAGAAAAQRKRKEAKRAKREQQERRGLSFVEDDE